MGGMSMHASGAMSVWTRMPGQTWPGFAASFLWMWITMMVPMMVPPFAVILWRRRQTGARDDVVMLGLGYFAVWSALGVVVIPIVVAASSIVARLRAEQVFRRRAAWRCGVRLGLHCARSCAPVMAIGFVLGGTGLVAMATTMIAVTVKQIVSTDRRRDGEDAAGLLRYGIPAFCNAVCPPTIGTVNDELLSRGHELVIGL